MRKKLVMPILITALIIPTLVGCGNSTPSFPEDALSNSSSSEEAESLGDETDDSSDLVTIDEETGEYSISDNAYDSDWLMENAEDIGVDEPEFIDDEGYYPNEEDQKALEDTLSPLVDEFGKTLFTMDENTEDYTEKIFAMKTDYVGREDIDLAQIPYYYSVMKESGVKSTYLKADIRQYYVYKDVENFGRTVRVAGFLDATINDDQTNGEDKDIANWFELCFAEKDGTWGLCSTYLSNRFAMDNVKFIHDPKQPKDNTFYISMVGTYRGVWNFGEDTEEDAASVSDSEAQPAAEPTDVQTSDK